MVTLNKYIAKTLSLEKIVWINNYLLLSFSTLIYNVAKIKTAEKVTDTLIFPYCYKFFEKFTANIKHKP